MVKRRGYANDPAVLLVDGEVAADSTVGADGVGPGLAAFIPGPGPAHVIFGLEHQGACGTDADAVAAIDTSRVGQWYFKFGGNVGGEAAAGHRNRECILSVYATSFHALVTQDTLGVIADVKLVVYLCRLRDRGTGCAEALRVSVVPLHGRLHRRRTGKIHRRSQKFQHQAPA